MLNSGTQRRGIVSRIGAGGGRWEGGDMGGGGAGEGLATFLEWGFWESVKGGGRKGERCVSLCLMLPSCMTMTRMTNTRSPSFLCATNAGWPVQAGTVWQSLHLYLLLCTSRRGKDTFFSVYWRTLGEGAGFVKVLLRVCLDHAEADWKLGRVRHRRFMGM